MPSIHSPESTSINRLADTEAEIARLTAELKAAKARRRAMTQNS
nr:hypothetical protein [Rhodococcus erythropolis]